MRVLLVQPELAPPGGGNLVAAWMLEALRDEHELSLLTWQRPDLAACNRHYGTSLRARDFAVLLVPAPARWLARHTPTPLALLKDSYLLRRVGPVASRYDVLIAANNEVDFGCRGIQYVNYPRPGFVRPPVDLRWELTTTAVREVYYRVCTRLCTFSPERMKANLTLVNSEWIGRRIGALHGIEPVTLHPPVPGGFTASVPWEEREDGFVCMGRISPEKRIETILEILERVRAGGRDVRLHVVGTWGDSPAYNRIVRRRLRQNATWASFHHDMARRDLVRLVSRQRYGIHAMTDEHFGIAVAEMARGGCIPFVPEDGGPAEIVGHDERLLFGSPDEAVEKIRLTLDDAARRDSLRAYLRGRARLFSTERFVAELRAIVRGFGGPPFRPLADLQSREPAAN